MAYQSSFTGAQIDDVIRICREIHEETDENGNKKKVSNLEYVDKLREYVKQIDTNTNSLELINNGKAENIPTAIKNELNKKISIDGGTMTGQIYKTINCKNGKASDNALIRINKTKDGPATYAPIYICGISDGDMSAGIHSIDNTSHKFVWYHHTGSGDSMVNKELASITTKGQVFGAVWNDFAEYRASDENCAGRVICECGNGFMTRATKRLQPGAEIVSDTFGFAIGRTKECNTPVAIAGRVLAYPNEKRDSYKPGDPVCAGPNGTISKMSRREVRKYPDRIIGVVSEIPDYDIWGENEIEVNGRIWIRIR